MAEIVTMPKLGLGMSFGVITEIMVKENDKVSIDQPLIAFETNKLSEEIQSPIDGYVLKIIPAVGDEVAIRNPVCVVGQLGEEYSLDSIDICSPEDAVQKAEASSSNSAIQTPVKERSATVQASPIAKKLAAEKGIDINLVIGTGPNGRIMREDVLAYEETLKNSPKPDGKESLIPLTQMRRAIAEHMSQSKKEIPHVYFETVADVNELLAYKKDLFENDGLKVTVNDLIVKCAAEAIKRVPEVNVSYTADGIVQHDDINIGIATTVEKGLLVPVIRGASNLSLAQLHDEASALIDKAKNNKIRPDDLSGGTFTVTNLGSFGVRSFHAIINYPEAAILAVCEIYKELELTDNGIENRPKINLSLSADHRVIDGAICAKYLKELKDIVENPKTGIIS